MKTKKKVNRRVKTRTLAVKTAGDIVARVKVPIYFWTFKQATNYIAKENAVSYKKAQREALTLLTRQFVTERMNQTRARYKPTN